MCLVCWMLIVCLETLAQIDNSRPWIEESMHKVFNWKSKSSGLDATKHWIKGTNC